MKKNLLYIENDSIDVYFNFALEYYLTTEKTFEDSTVLLFWRTSPTLMVGKFQNTLEEINQKYVEEKNIRLVRRMSGGGTIYTDLGGWQYSFITKAEGAQIRFQEYIEPVIQALSGLGIDARFNGRNDLVIDGKKFSGTAQYMHNGFVVHHGSLLFGTDLEEMVKSTTVSQYKIISKGIKSVRDRVTNISDHLQQPIGIQEFKELMISSLIGETGRRYSLTKNDIERIHVLAAEKFNNWHSIYGKNPKCNIIREGHFSGGNMEIHLDVKNSRIVDAAIYGDFFGQLSQEEIEQALIGCAYSRKELEQALGRLELDKTLYNISSEEILNTII